MHEKNALFSATSWRPTRRTLLQAAGFVLASGVLASPTAGSRSAVEQAEVVRKRIYIAADDHTDYFWTAGEADYRQAFLDTLDYYLDLADATAGNPPEHQSRWNCDGSFWLWTYEKNKPAADFARLIERIRSGHISVPLNALCVCLGGAPAEAVLRGMYYPGQIERRYKLRLPLAYLMENQTLPYGVVALMAGSGAKYSWKGICGCDSRVPDAGDREHDIYWWVGPDQSRMLMKWNSMLMGSQGLGGYAEAYYPSQAVDFVDGDPGFIARYPYAVIGAFGKGWDDFQTQTDEFVTVAAAKTSASRLVIVSNEEDFFEDFEATYGDVIPQAGASFGNEWDLYCAAMAEVSARVKRAVEKLRTAEALATLVILEAPAHFDGLRSARDQAWMDLGLFWEHNWGMVGPPSGLTNERIAWQTRLASEIETYVSNLYALAQARLGASIARTGDAERFYAFNPLSWTRSDYADFPYSGGGPVHVFDLAVNAETPCELVQVNGIQTLRIVAENVPALGYKVFEVREGSGQTFENAASVNGNVLENARYRITIAERGAITSLIDKTQAGREFAGVIGGRTVNDLGASAGTVEVEHAGPVSVTVLATASSPLAHTVRVSLFRNSERIEIQNDINEGFDGTFTWAFSFDLANPAVWHEEVGAVIKADLLAAGGHYSPRNARYDWLTLNHFADISSGQSGVTLSNMDCYFMQLGDSTVAALDTATPQIKALAGGKVVGVGGGLPDQGGDKHFLQRFALRTHTGFDAVEAMKLALEHQNPLATGEVTGQGAAFPADQFSLLTISNPNVLLWALKPADDGAEQGIIARVWNLSTAEAGFQLSMLHDDILNAQRTTHIETPIESADVVNGALQATLAAHQMRTYLLKLPLPLPLTGTPDLTSTPPATLTPRCLFLPTTRG